MWHRRASVAAFVNLAKHDDGNFMALPRWYSASAQLLGSQERFAQTGVGRVLRKLSRSDEARVAGFVEAKLVAPPGKL
jgi:3-methyladenine DNA glycosylase AlkD